MKHYVNCISEIQFRILLQKRPEKSLVYFEFDNLIITPNKSLICALSISFLREGDGFLFQNSNLSSLDFLYDY